MHPTEQNRLLELLKRPVVTEKTTRLNEDNQYVFYVNKDANKIELAKAFELAYPGRKVKAVRLIKVPGETRRSGRRYVRRPDKRKAVFSVIGEPLEFFAGGV